MDSFDQRKQDLAKQIAEKWMERGFTVDYLVMELELDRKIIEQIFAGDVRGIEMKILQGIRAKIRDFHCRSPLILWIYNTKKPLNFLRKVVPTTRCFIIHCLSIVYVSGNLIC